MHNHKSKFTHGDIVYQKIDIDKSPMMVVAVQFSPLGVSFGCSKAGDDSTSWFYEIEITGNINEVILFTHLL